MLWVMKHYGLLSTQNNRQIIHSSRTCSLERSSKRTFFNLSFIILQLTNSTLLLLFLLYPYLIFHSKPKTHLFQ